MVEEEKREDETCGGASCFCARLDRTEDFSVFDIQFWCVMNMYRKQVGGLYV